MTLPQDEQLQPLFQALKEAVLSQPYRVSSYALNNSVDRSEAMQRIQRVLEKILLLLITVEDEFTQRRVLDGLKSICSDTSEAFLMDWFYKPDLMQDEDYLYEIGSFFLDLYRTRRADLYAAAYRHSSPYLRVLLINQALRLEKNVSLEDLQRFIDDELNIVRDQAVELLTEYPQIRYIPFYLQLLEDRTVYEYWDDICEALIEVGVPDEAFAILVKNYAIAIETDLAASEIIVSEAILKTLLVYNRDLTLKTFLAHLNASDHTLKWTAVKALETIQPEELKDKPGLLVESESGAYQDDPVAFSHFETLLEALKKKKASLQDALKVGPRQPAHVLPLLLAELNPKQVSLSKTIAEVIFYYCLSEKEREQWMPYAPLLEDKFRPFLSLRDTDLIYYSLGIFVKIKVSNDIAYFQALLKHDNQEVRRYLLFHLRQSNYSDFKALFYVGFRDSSEVVRQEAIQAMSDNQDRFLNTHFKDILSDPSHQNRALGLSYLSKHHPQPKIACVVDSLFDSHSEDLFAQTRDIQNQGKTYSQRADQYEYYLSTVMEFLFELKSNSYCNNDKRKNQSFREQIDQIYLSIFERLPHYFKLRMVTHMKPFLLKYVMDFIIAEAGTLSKEDKHYLEFIQIVSSYFGDAYMSDLLIYLDTRNPRLMILALQALCKISRQGFPF